MALPKTLLEFLVTQAQACQNMERWPQAKRFHSCPTLELEFQQLQRQELLDREMTQGGLFSAIQLTQVQSIVQGSLMNELNWIGTEASCAAAQAAFSAIYGSCASAPAPSIQETTSPENERDLENSPKENHNSCDQDTALSQTLSSPALFANTGIPAKLRKEMIRKIYPHTKKEVEENMKLLQWQAMQCAFICKHESSCSSPKVTEVLSIKPLSCFFVIYSRKQSFRKHWCHAPLCCKYI